MVRLLGLGNQNEWMAWSKSGARPANMPSNPHKVYRNDGWLGWKHWLWHSNPGPATAPPAARAKRKRAAPDCAAGASAKAKGKQQRR